MLLSQNRVYQSALSAQEINSIISHLSREEAGFWILKTEKYKVEISEGYFTVLRRSSTQNGPVFPVVSGAITDGSPVQVDLTIKPTTEGYFVILLCVVISGILSISILMSDEMKVNGVYRTLELWERVVYTLFPLSICAVLCYVKVFKPMSDTEAWLVKKLALIASAK
ncbi:hypothetical protein K3G63_10465 [Hymenobacter sp. HSC-4F20]|uniref:hypothetical protein n=1 Tax=Hymenobacter sp. HSC-4F20 TaxID=2864135 RepID=UPI001C73A55E|nr:hypothetical protein [Hymenobacter sp. HSC-4F20]MBX0290864.1 hypothetical protein [Hymenobacter sp. HSC-4F20]